MDKSLKILVIGTECVPYAKTGGMGDVIGALPVALKKLNNDIRIVIPKFSFIDEEKYRIKPFIKSMYVYMGDTTEYCSVYTTITKEGIPVYFIEYNPYFERNGIYHDENFNDYPDNPKRFAFFACAALQLCKEIDFKPDIVHANDWHTALIPAYLKIRYYNDPILKDAASVLTIHNVSYQGVYPKLHYNYTGLGENNFTIDKFECYGGINFLKGGIYFADTVNTVSIGNARASRTPEGGFGIDTYLRDKGDRYVGIINGVDYSQWDPASDSLIPANYSIANLQGKIICKNVLQQRLGMEQNSNIPVIGIVSRFAPQKGLDMLAQCIKNIVQDMIVQFAILGSDDKRLEAFYGHLPKLYPDRIGSFIGYSDELAHLIEAGSDFFLMPSIYEPCGLNQIYSLRYGTLPIVRATGGLDDTVKNYDERTGEGTGFKFWEPSVHAIYYTVGWAVSTYYDRKPHIKKLMKNAMKKDFSWEKSAKLYIKLYHQAMDIKRKSKS